MCLAARIVGIVIVTRSTNGSRPAGPLVARRSSTASWGEPGKEGGEMAVRAQAEQQQIELDALERLVELVGRLGRRQLAADPMHLGRVRFDPVEQRLGGEPVVRQLVVRRHAALVPPPQRDEPQSGSSAAASSYARPGRRAAGEHDRAATCGLVGEQPRDSSGRVVGDVQLRRRRGHAARVRDPGGVRRAGRRSRAPPIRRTAARSASALLGLDAPPPQLGRPA